MLIDFFVIIFIKPNQLVNNVCALLDKNKRAFMNLILNRSLLKNKLLLIEPRTY